MGAKGIDIFRVYQTVTDWSAVRGSEVEFCWIKATHGLGIATYNADRNYAPAPADPTVAGARSVGIAPGLYHWGKGNDPEREADVFAGEVIRLGCRGPGTLPPALDAEDEAIAPTWAARRAWCVAFLRRLQDRIGQQRVAIYMSASWAQALRPDQWDLPGLVIWIAAYGSNSGVRSPQAVTQFYGGRVDIQQFTSLGMRLVAGISSEGLDVSEANTPIDQIIGGDDMSLTELIDFRPDLGGAPRNLWDGINQVLANQGAHSAVLEVLATNQGLDPEQMRAAVDEAVKKYSPTPEQIAAAQEATIAPLVAAALKQVQDTDNLDEAKATVAELLRQIGTLVPATPALS